MTPHITMEMRIEIPNAAPKPAQAHNLLTSRECIFSEEFVPDVEVKEIVV